MPIAHCYSRELFAEFATPPMRHNLFPSLLLLGLAACADHSSFGIVADNGPQARSTRRTRA